MGLSAPPPFALGTFQTAGSTAPYAGVVIEGEWVVPVSSLAEVAPDATLLDVLNRWEAIEPVLADATAKGKTKGRTAPHRLRIDEVRTLAPLAPRQILCTGANYRQHVIDLVVAQGAGADTEGMTVEQRRAHVTRRTDERARSGMPYAFPKLASSVAGPTAQVVVPKDAIQFDWELELGVVIGKEAWRVDRSAALDVVAGYSIVNDLTRRELVYRSDIKSLGTDWLRAKSGPGFMPFGPWVVPKRFIPDPQALHLELKLNGQVMQSESTGDMLFNVARQIEYLSQFVRLLPGDLIATGSPAGNGMHHGRFIRPGDVIEASISGLGRQVTAFISEE